MNEADDSFRDRIEEYLDDSLSRADRARMQSHLSECEHCAKEVEDYQRIRRLALAMPPVEIPDDLGYRIRKRLETEVGLRGEHRRSRLIPLSFAAAAVAAGILLAVLLRGDEPKPEEHPVVISWRTPTPVSVGPALADWLEQAENAPPGDATQLVLEARDFDLLRKVRVAQETARGDRLRYYRAAEDLLVQAANDPSSGFLAMEARTVRANRP